MPFSIKTMGYFENEWIPIAFKTMSERCMEQACPNLLISFSRAAPFLAI